MTRFGLIGCGLKHTLSPLIHNARFADKKISAQYSVVDLSENMLTRDVLNDFDGLNVTIPYKQKVMSLLDETEDTAFKIGAVNTIVNNGVLKGYNTDLQGFLHIVNRCGAKLDKNVLVLGYGGVAQTVLYAVKNAGGRATVVTRRQDLKAEDVTYVGYDDKVLTNKFDLIVNCTPVGMYPNQDACPLKNFNATCVIDLIYNPVITKFLTLAEQKGITFCGGLEMLVVQALESEKLWLGIDYDKNDILKLKNVCLEALI